MYILFEGVDTCGKTTQIELLKKEFKDLIFTKEPGGTKIGKEIREILLHKGVQSKEAELFLFLADRAEHFKEVIEPNLDKTVISDRGFISGIAYFLANGDFQDKEFLIKLNKFALKNSLPQKTVFFKTDKETIKKRLKGKNEDMIEKRGIEYLLKVQNIMESLLKELKLEHITIDSKKDIKEINTIIKGYIFDD
ncbi:MAG: dTMP kinase [Epsilonproteobacteria bacterium]|nr:dTMP kinase [Campylobacterota bacterium]